MVPLISLKLLVYIPLFLKTPEPKNDSKDKIIHFEFMKDYCGNYTFGYETSNGISRNETGTSVNFGGPDAYTQVNGTLNYTEPDNNIRTIWYIADNNVYNWTDDGKHMHSTKVTSPTSLKLIIYVPSVLASHPIDDGNGTITTFLYMNDGRGGYHMSYETSNGVSRKETGTIVNAGQPNEYESVKGIVEYQTVNNEKDGIQWKGVEYIVDRNGYKLVHTEGGYLGLVNTSVLATLLGGGSG